MINTSRTMLWSVCTALLVFWASSAYASNGFAVIEKNNCASCHNLTGIVGLKTVGLWRKGPDLYYAGNKYRQSWVEAWLQNPKRIRPAGAFYLDHVQSGKKSNVIRNESLKEHVKLNARDAQAVAVALAELTPKNALIKAESYDPSIDPGTMGELMFDKVNGCMACHSIDRSYGGLSGPEVYTAGKRLKPEYMLSYIRDPQAWNPKTWMPTRQLSEENMQKLVNYIISLSGDDLNKYAEASAVESVAQKYRTYCMQCHGIAGSGAGINARDMAVPARNHTDGKYIEARTDDELFKVIKEGGLAINKSSLMPPWGGTLSDSEIKAMVKHIRKLCNCKYEGGKSK